MGTGFDVSIPTCDIGIIPRAVEYLFQGIHELQEKAKEENTPPPDFKVNAQFMEVSTVVNILRLEQNGPYVADDILIFIFFNKYICILIETSLKFVLASPIDNKSALVLVMAWHQTGAKPLPEPMLT